MEGAQAAAARGKSEPQAAAHQMVFEQAQQIALLEPPQDQQKRQEAKVNKPAVKQESAPQQQQQQPQSDRQRNTQHTSASTQAQTTNKQANKPCSGLVLRKAW